MNWMLRLLPAAVASFGLSACVNLEVDHLPAAAQIDAAPSVDKPSYFLSKTSLGVTGTFTLNDCDGIVASAGLAAGKHLDEDTPPIDLTESFTVAVTNDADRDFEYTIPLDATRSWAKQLNLAIARNANKTLVSVNGTIADQAGPTLLAAAQTAIAIGGAVALPAAAPLIATVTTKAIQVEDKGAETARDRQYGLVKGRKPTAPIYKTILVHKTVMREGPTPAFVPRNFCSKDVQNALLAIGEQQKRIAAATAALAKKKAAAAGKSDASAQPDPAVVKAQAVIARIRAENNLTRTIHLVWTPSRAELIAASRDANGKYASTDSLIVPKIYDLFGLVVASHWFSQAGKDAAIREAACVNGDSRSCDGIVAPSKAVAHLISPLTVELVLKSWTVGRAYDEDPLDPAGTKIAPPATHDGIVYRDPALSTIRVCQGACGGELVTSMTAGSIKPIAMPSRISTRTDFDNALLETTADLATLTAPIAQFGRLNEVSMRSKLFETSVATLLQNPDGSIASVGTQSSNAAAAGFAAATAAANAQSSAIAARNTATTAVNTALGAKAQYADTLNKALADCLAQQATITAQGGQPIGQCQ